MDKINQTILIVDDEDLTLFCLTEALELLGYHVFPVKSVLSAVDIIEQYPIDLVLADMLMPGLSGVDLVKFLKDYVNTPVILMTAHPMNEMNIELFNLGIDNFLIKPFGLNQLKRALNSVLN